MCGIAGIVNFDNKPVQHTDLKKMTDVIIHRGPDGEGHWINETKNVGFGHRRLSIIDLSTAGKQPMSSKNNKYTITFNGEIYNYIEIKEELRKKGYVFLNDTDTEVVLAAYEEWGKNCLQKFDGMFALALWDNEKQELFCARDRFGEKPFFYFKNDKQLIFASEIKQFWELGLTRKPSSKFIYNYLLFGTIQDSNSMEFTYYEDILNLEAAHYMVIRNGEIVKTEKYWDIDLTVTNRAISFEEACSTFRDMFTTSIKRRLRSDVPVGSSLSGGIDSSSIVSLISEFKNESQIQKTFSARFENFKKDEGNFIKQVVEKYRNIEAFEVYPNENSALNNLEKIIYHQDEPFGSFSISAQFEVMQLAKQNNITVLLDGQGADEYLAGYLMYFESYYNQLYASNKALYNSEIHSYKAMYDIDFKTPNLSRKLKTKSESIYQFAAEIRRKKINPKSNYFVGIHPDIVEKNRGNRNPLDKPANLKEHLYTSCTKKGISELLRYADRNSMAHSLEVRLPFLSHQLIEFVFSLPEEYIIRDSWTKYILRKSMADILPNEITWRKDKIGYEPPQKRWLASNKFKEMVKESQQKLLDEKIISNANTEQSWKHLMIASYL